MNIYARRGAKVRYCHPSAGYEYDQELCRKYLTLNAIYTVDRTEVHSCSTNVWLQEAPGVTFNSVMFDSVTE